MSPVIAEPISHPHLMLSTRLVCELGDPHSRLRATTDRSGAFTLNGLRPGSAYSLVAESDDDRGRLSGRAEAEASETGVEISLTGAEETNPPFNISLDYDGQVLLNVTITACDGRGTLRPLFAQMGAAVEFWLA